LYRRSLKDKLKKQVPVYFVSKVLSLSKKNYTELEKVLYVVLMASRKLRHYFQASEGYYEEQRSYWKGWKVGCGAQ
jgi:hypothetical protein